MGLLNFLRRRSRKQVTAAPVAPAYKPSNEAAAILAWSFREMFKYRDGEREMSLWNELGWWLAQDLYSYARAFGSHEFFLDDPLELKRRPGTNSTYGRCAPLVEKINDPVITALWELGTLRALSDMLAHLVLRAEQPGLLRWNTADHFKAHGVNLYAINDAYVQTLNAGSTS